MMKPDDDAPSDVISDEHKIELMARSLFGTWVEYSGGGATARWAEMNRVTQEAWRHVASTALRDAPPLLVEPIELGAMQVTTLYAMHAKQPMVQVDFPKPTTRIQLRASDTRSFVDTLLDASNAAETDAFLIEWLTDQGVPEGQKYGMLRKFRQWRDARIGGQPEQDGDPGNAVVGRPVEPPE